jgi:cellulase
MRTAAAFILAAAELVAGHATFQNIAKNGGAQSTTGVRGTSNQNNPILSTADALASDMMICKGGDAVAGSFEVAGGDKLQLQWHHNQGPASGDADEPIAASHKGPIMVYITPAATEGKSGWVKIMEDGFTNGQSAVDKFIANKGVIDVTLPDLKAGDYLIRSEIIALHEANTAGKAQFYNGCGQIKVTSAGSVTLPAGVDLRTVYKTDDAGVKFNIYGGTVTSYPIPGPKLFSASSGGAAPAPAPSSTKPAAPSTTAAAPSATAPAATSAAPAAPTSAAPAAPTTAKPAAPSTMVTSVKPAPTQGSGSGAVAQRYYQCGGKGFSGPTSCASSYTCQFQNDYYSQCL